MSKLLQFGIAHDSSFINPFSMSTRYNSINVSTTPIELLLENGSESPFHGTGFFYRHNNKPYLITNWHNFSGANPFTNENMHNGGFIPGKIRYHVPVIVGDTQVDLTSRIPVELALYEFFDKPFWLEHPAFHNKRIDVVAIALEYVPQGCCLNELTQSGGLLHLVGHDLFIPGYPFRAFAGSMPPIWKRGSFASEPSIPVDNRPMFLVDAATRSGMSGSPILRVHFGPKPGPGPKFEIEIANIQHIELVGIYSGHLDAQAEKITIGLGWYSILIEEIINSNVLGTRP